MGPESPEVLTLLDTVSQSGAIEGLAPPLRIALMLGAMALLSVALVSLTAFTRIIIVLSFVKRSLTTQEIPPNQVVIGLAMFLTAFVMGPTLDELQREAITPYLNESMTGVEAIQIAGQKMHTFMLSQTRETDLAVMLDIAEVATPSTPEEVPMRILIPSFMISELKTGFIMGFCIYIPFLLIDLVVSSVLMSLGMMMMPPMMISLPFKILLFVLVDGWQLVAKTLSLSFG
jgi:flagellar biosynthetic protein FliP